MKLETFFEKFDQVAGAPNAVAKMRELVLRLATAGLLTEQRDSDGSGIELLRQITEKRERLLAEGKIRQKTADRGVEAGDTVSIPSNWVRTTISEICYLLTGATPSRQVPKYFGGQNPWLVSGDINRGEIFDCEGRITDEGLASSNCKIIEPGSVLIALNGQGKTRATVAMLRIHAACNQSLVAMVPYSRDLLIPEYVFWNLRGRYWAIRDITGQKQRRGLNMGLVGSLSIPLPPLAEQKRIVAKVDELMTLCDQLEAQQQERDTQHTVLARASLTRFADAPTPGNLKFLFHKSYDIDPADLRNTIYSLAVGGKLSPTESPWTTSSFGREFDIHGGTQPPKARFVHSPRNGYVRLLQIRDLGNKPVPTYVPKDSVRRFCDEDDLLIGRYGASVGKIFRGQKGAYNVALAKLVWDRKVFSQGFLEIWLKSGVFQGHLAGASRSAQAGFNKRDLASLKIRFPCLEDQNLIVAKTNELMALLEDLEKRISSSRIVAEELLDAIVAELTAAGASSPTVPA